MNRRFLYPLISMFAVALFAMPSVSSADVPLEKDRELFIGGEVQGSLLTSAAGRSLVSPAFGFGIRLGYRWDTWGIIGGIENNYWLESEFDNDVVYGAFNIGIGFEARWANGFVSTSFLTGPSILMFDTIIDEAGKVGIYVDIRPAGFRWNPWDDWVLKFEPITFTIVAPVLSGIPLVQLENRSVFTVEYLF